MQQFLSSNASNDNNLYKRILLISSLSQILSDSNKHNILPSINKASPSSIKSSQSFLKSNITDDDIVYMCKYFNPNLQPIKQSKFIMDKLTNFKDKQQQNSCLHIAVQYGNRSLMKYLLKYYNNQNQKELVDLDYKPLSTNSLSYNKINQLNRNQDTPLMHCLRTNSLYKMEKIVLQLSKYTDLTLKDKNNFNIYQIPLPAYSISKVRILDYLKQKYQQKIKK